MSESRPAAPVPVTPTPVAKPPAAKPTETGSMGLVESTSAPSSQPSKIKLTSDTGHIQSKLNRKPNVTHSGACRVKTFIGKVSGPGLEYMDNAINVWLDQHPEIEVKFVSSTIGQLDGKVERAIVTSVWY